MQVSVEKVSNVERRLTIVVPENQVQEAYGKQLNKIAKKAKINGFRQGKIPLSYIESRFGQEARQEALNEVIQNSLYQALNQEKLIPISTPKVEPKEISADKPLEYIASFEILPEIGAVNANITEIEKLKVDITDNDVERVIEQLQKQYTKWQVVDREAQEKDRVVIDYYAIFEGKSDIENKVEKYTLELGSGVMLPGFEAGLIGAKPGEQRTLELKFPEEFSVPERAGKPVTFIVDIQQVFEADMPEIDEQFIKKLGVVDGNLASLQDQIRKSLEMERDRTVNEKLKEQVFKQLLEQNPIDVPASLISREAKNIHDEIYQHQKEHKHDEHSQDELNAFNDVAKRRVSLGILLAEYAKQSNIKADAERVKKKIQEIATSYEHPKEVIAWLSADEQRRGIESQILEDQVLEKLLENTSITEKIQTYAELKGIRI